MRSTIRHATLALALAGCNTGNAETSTNAAEHAVPVRVASVEARPVSDGVRATGTIAGKEEVSLSFKIGGVVSRVTVHPGDVVQRGQLLAELAPTEITAQVAKAVEARDKAARDVERIRALYHDSVATLEQLQNATTTLGVAEHDVKIASFNRQYAAIHAPSRGVVLRRLVEPNQLVSPGDVVVDVRSAEEGIVLRVGLPDRDIVRVRRGDDAMVVLDAVPGRTFQGRVTQVAPAASAGTGTYEVEVSLERDAANLASGLVGRATIAARGAPISPVVPVDALVEADGDSAVVYVVPSGTDRARRRVVRLGPLLGAEVAVTAGLIPGEHVIVAGSAYVDDSVRVAVSGTAPKR